jgi:3',5'-cyclic AMP phosphodiesterase CpdA
VPAPFRLAFFSDPHLAPPPLRWRDLAGKRVTGWLNWRLGRAARHDMAALDLITADILAWAPDHVVCGGDLANFGLPAEFAAARRFLDRFGPPGRVSLTPGNHSLYVRGAEADMAAALGPFMTGDGEEAPAFPFLRRRGPVALIGLNSACPNPPFDATGLLGEAQIEAASLLLAAMAGQGLARIVVLHHPPHVGGAPRSRRLRDAEAFEAMLAEAGADLVLHGHNHVPSIAHRMSANGLAPIVGAGSASERDMARGRRPVWLAVTVAAKEGGGHAIAIVERGLDQRGGIVASPLSLA